MMPFVASETRSKKNWTSTQSLHTSPPVLKLIFFPPPVNLLMWGSIMFVYHPSVTDLDWLLFTELQCGLELWSFSPVPSLAARLQLPRLCAISAEGCELTYQIRAEPDSLVTKSMQIHPSRRDAAEPGQVWTKWCLSCEYHWISPASAHWMWYDRYIP